MHRALKQFGYDGLTVAEVREAADSVLAGTDSDTDVIAVMVKAALQDAGIVKP